MIKRKALKIGAAECCLGFGVFGGGGRTLWRPAIVTERLLQLSLNGFFNWSPLCFSLKTFFCVYGCFVYIYVYHMHAWCLHEARWYWVSWNWSYGWSWATLCVLQIQPEFSGKAVCLNGRALSPALRVPLLLSLLPSLCLSFPFFPSL